MANTNMDNYIDSLEKGAKIEFEGSKLTFDRFEPDCIVCECGTEILISDFHDDLEFWENHIFGQYAHDEKIDKEVDLAINENK